MKNHLFLLLFSLATGYFARGQCPPGQDVVRLEIAPDQYFTEVSWQLTDLDGAEIYASGNCTQGDPATFQYCVPRAVCKVFRIKDQYGDGLPGGYYSLFLNDSLVYFNSDGNYHFGENVYFGCPPAGFCNTAAAIDTGSWTAPAGLVEKWYRFTPSVTGTYRVSTCSAENACLSKIWLYDQCENLTLSDDQTGANYYAAGGCSHGAVGTLYLSGGKDYFIRLRYAGTTCLYDSMHFDLHYLGAIAGCTDPAACNYNPLATVSDTCIYPGSPDCLDGPDLMVLEDELRNSMYAQVLYSSDVCQVEEGCLRGTGSRTLIRFKTHIRNIGNLDYYIGKPPASSATPSSQFVYDDCHHHWHYRGYAEYVLYNSAGQRLPVGTKNGFCVLDLECTTGEPQYSCANMGISAGCGDTYNASLPCQWVDITGLPADHYTLVVRVNWDKSPDQAGRVEKNYANNWAQGCFQLSYAGNVAQVEFLDNDCPQYTDCLGDVFGDTQPDCEGTCNGPALRGDWDKNALRDTADLEAYITAALQQDSPVTECRDLFADGRIDVYDAALLQECNLYADVPEHWGSRFPCQFPTGFAVNSDAVFLFAGALDTVAKTFDVGIANPFNPLLGYQFTVKGLQIDSVENLVPGFAGTIRFDSVSGRILGLSAQENAIPKNLTQTALLRVHYHQLTAQSVCIVHIDAVVNTKYRKSSAAVGNSGCVTAILSGATAPVSVAFPVLVQPNPFREETTLFYPNPAGEAMTLTLRDLTGRVLRRYTDVRAESITLERGGVPAGSYIFTLQSSRASVSGRLTVW